MGGEDDDTPIGACRYGIGLGKKASITAGGAQPMELLPFQLHDATSAATIAEVPVYSVYLSDLFPFLKTNQLPAFMIDEEIHIDITFQDEVSSLSTVVDAAPSSIRMCCDNTGERNVSYQIN